MASALDPVLLGVISTLTSAPALGAIVGVRVFDTVAPQGTPFPYITITSPTESAFDVFHKRGNAGSLTLHIWDRDTGLDSAQLSSRTTHAIYAEIEKVLNLQAIGITGADLVRGSLSYIVGMIDADGITYHGVARYDVLTFESAAP
jgi:Protein of unknown function (DUF3168)